MKVSHALAPACLFSLLSCASAFALDANEEITDPVQGFDYLVYSVTWQPSFCVLKPDTAGCATPPQRFLTHGIWPYKNSTAEKTNRVRHSAIPHPVARAPRPVTSAKITSPRSPVSSPAPTWYQTTPKQCSGTNGKNTAVAQAKATGTILPTSLT